MDMSKYMTFDATYEEFDSMDDDTHMSSFKEARTIKVFIYGRICLYVMKIIVQ